MTRTIGRSNKKIRNGRRMIRYLCVLYGLYKGRVVVTRVSKEIYLTRRELNDTPK